MFKKIASNTIAQVFSKVVSAILALFLVKILTNYLSPSLFGLYNVVYDYTGIFVFLADLGLYAITIKEITNNKEKSASIVGNVMSLRIIFGVGILFISLFLALFLDGYNSHLALAAIFISSVFTILQLVNSSILALLQANMKMEIPAFSFIVGKIVNVVLVAGLAYYFFPKHYVDLSGSLVPLDGFFVPFLWIFGVATIGVFVNTLLNYLYARKIVHFGLAFDWEYIKYIFKKSLPYGIALFLSVLYFKIDIIFLPIIEGEALGNLSAAYYKLPMKITEVIMVLAGFYMSSILPKLSEGYKNNDTKLLQTLITLSFKVLFSFAILVFVIGILFRENIILIMANDQYLHTGLAYNSADAFLIVFFVILFYFISVIFIYVLLASENHKVLLKINIFVTLFNIIGNIILIPKYSFMGAGVITICSQIILFVSTFIATKHILPVRLPYLYILRNIIVGIVLFLTGNLMIEYFGRGVYFDLFVFGGILFIFYMLYVFLEYKNQKKNLA